MRSCWTHQLLAAGECRLAGRAAPPCDGVAHPLRRARSAGLPRREAVEYKYVIHSGEEGVLEWQPCDNLVLEVKGAAAAVTVTDAWWGDAREVAIEPRPGPPLGSDPATAVCTAGAGCRRKRATQGLTCPVPDPVPPAAATAAETLLSAPLAEEEATDVAKPFAAAVPMPVLVAPEEAVQAAAEETEAVTSVVAKLVLEASALAAAVVEAPTPAAAEPAQPAAITVAAAAVAAEVANVVPARLPKAQKAAPKQPSSSTAAPKRAVAWRRAATPAASAGIPALLPRPSMTPAAASRPSSSRGLAGSAVRAASFTAAPEDMSLAALKAALKVRPSTAWCSSGLAAGDRDPFGTLTPSP